MNRTLLLLLMQKAISASKRKSDPHAGPGDSFPLDPEHLDAAWDLAGHAADPDAIRRHVIEYAKEHGLTGDLPGSAHVWAEAHGIAMKADGLWVAKSALIEKAWTGSDGCVYIEGWISTPDQDIQGDIVLPEAFAGKALTDYAARRMPLSSEHGKTYSGRKLGDYPIGHMQRVALVRDGRIFDEATHITDPTEFEHFPGSGTGVYGRGVINEHTAATSVAKGNIGGFSWIGKVAKWEALPGGGKRYQQVDPWLESTIAAYPINGNAKVLAARSAAE
jgi:hypothetical protein